MVTDISACPGYSCPVAKDQDESLPADLTSPARGYLTFYSRSASDSSILSGAARRFDLCANYWARCRRVKCGGRRRRDGRSCSNGWVARVSGQSEVGRSETTPITGRRNSTRRRRRRYYCRHTTKNCPNYPSRIARIKLSVINTEHLRIGCCEPRRR